ncbi:MAG: hypothetical protein ABR497_01845 [Kiritimatiellia bacterium]|nr:hypothetical protein [Lentisphaerota bacterium]
MIMFSKPNRRSWGLAVIISAGFLSLCGARTSTREFQRRYQLLDAERQFAGKEFAESREVFRELAGSSGSKVEGEMLLARAAIALGHQEEQLKAAMQEAAALEHEMCRVYTLVSLMSLESDWTGIIEKFGDKPVNTWDVVRAPARPRGADEELRTLVLLKRARAFEQTGAYDRAEQDLALAADLLVSKHTRANPGLLGTLTKLAELRANRLNDFEGAFEANRRIAQEGLGRGSAGFFRAVLRAGAHLRSQGQYDAAIEMIQLMSPRNLSPESSWYAESMLDLARTCQAAGRIAEAANICAEMLAQPNLHARFKPQVLQLQAELQAESGNPD